MQSRGASDRRRLPPVIRWLVVFAVVAVAAGAGRPSAVLSQSGCPEPNDSRQNACVVEPGVLSGQVDRNGDVDVYRFESLDFGAVARIAVDGAVTARVFGWGDRVLADTAGSDGSLDLTLPAPGAYYVSVAAAEGRPDARAYRLQLELGYPGVPPAVLYRNLFRTPSDADWIVDPDGIWRYEIANGGLQVAPISAGTRGSSWRSWPSVYADLTMTIDGVIEEGWIDNDDAGLMIGVRNNQRTSDAAGPGDDLRMDVEAHGRTVLVLYQYNAYQWLAEPVQAAQPIGPGEAVRMTLRAQGDEVEAFLNGVSMAHARDATLTAGRIALGAYTTGPPLRVRFDDLLVTTPTVGQISGPLGAGIDRSPGAVLYADDFDDPARSRLKASREPGPAAWAFADGEFAIRIVDPDSPHLPRTFLPVVSPSAVLQVDARIEGDVDGRFISLNCRDQVAEKSSSYRLTVDPFGGRFMISWWDDGTEIVRVRWTTSDAIRRGNATNTIELGCTGTTIFVRMNGTEVARVSESAYPNGRFTIGGGVFTDRKPAASDVRFDNLVIRQI